jgi:hypothetical protein
MNVDWDGIVLFSYKTTSEAGWPRLELQRTTISHKEFLVCGKTMCC